METVTIIVQEGVAEVRLTRMEAALYRLLAAEVGETFTHERIWTEVWGFVPARKSNSLPTFVSQLRKKLKPWFEIHNHFGIGYSLRRVT